MTFHLTRYQGEIIDNPSLIQLVEALEELQKAEDQDNDIWLSDDNGWFISVFGNGKVVFAKADSSESYWMESVKPAKILALWQLLLKQEIEQLQAEDWQSQLTSS